MQAPKQTNWHVITGAPCSGKTAVIDRLAGQGYRTVPEMARSYIDSRLAQGHTLEQIKADALAFEGHILMEKVRIERRLPSDQLVFMDRAVPDSIAYFKIEGLDPAHPLSLSQEVRYKSVFLFERLAFEKDAVRSESHETAARLEALLQESYARLGYALVRVPVMPVDQRTAFILAHARAAGP